MSNSYGQAVTWAEAIRKIVERDGIAVVVLDVSGAYAVQNNILRIMAGKVSTRTVRRNETLWLIVTDKTYEDEWLEDSLTLDFREKR